MDNLFYRSLCKFKDPSSRLNYFFTLYICRSNLNSRFRETNTLKDFSIKVVKPVRNSRVKSKEN